MWCVLQLVSFWSQTRSTKLQHAFHTMTRTKNTLATLTHTHKHWCSCRTSCLAPWELSDRRCVMYPSKCWTCRWVVTQLIIALLLLGTSLEYSAPFCTMKVITCARYDVPITMMNMLLGLDQFSSAGQVGVTNFLYHALSVVAYNDSNKWHPCHLGTSQHSRSRWHACQGPWQRPHVNAVSQFKSCCGVVVNVTNDMHVLVTNTGY